MGWISEYFTRRKAEKLKKRWTADRELEEVEKVDILFDKNLKLLMRDTHLWMRGSLQAPDGTYSAQSINDAFLAGMLSEFLKNRPELPTPPALRQKAHMTMLLSRGEDISWDKASRRALNIFDEITLHSHEENPAGAFFYFCIGAKTYIEMSETGLLSCHMYAGKLANGVGDWERPAPSPD